MNNNINTMIFDFGGTLDTNGIHWSDKYLEVINAEGIKFDIESFNKAFVKSDEHLMTLVNKRNFTYYALIKEQLTYILNEIYSNIENIIINKILNNLWGYVENCIKDSISILELLKPNYKIGLVSNFYGNISEICRDIGIDKFFDVMLDSKVVNISKPNPEIFSLAIKNLNSQPEDTIVIGDSYTRDILPSKAIGCKTVWLNKKSCEDFNKAESADYKITDIKDLKNIFKF